MLVDDTGTLTLCIGCAEVTSGGAEWTSGDDIGIPLKGALLRAGTGTEVLCCDMATMPGRKSGPEDPGRVLVARPGGSAEAAGALPDFEERCLGKPPKLLVANCWTPLA